MSHWVFSNATIAEAAQKIVAKLLPKDTFADGSIAPVQITNRWADLVTLTDGRVAFLAHPSALKPAIAALVADISALLPPADSPIAP